MVRHEPDWEDEMSSDRGYIIGPNLPPDVRPWDYQWESDPRIDDGHAHEWELVLLEGDGERRRFTEEVVRCRCSNCHAPRCGDSRDEDPCMERRHHRGLHIYLSGMFEPLGGF
jgi:hypothetical protein